MPAPDPRDTILGFLDALPVTIRVGTQTQVALYLALAPPGEHLRDPLPIIQTALAKEEIFDMMGALIQVGAVIDYVLTQSVLLADQRRALLAEMSRQFEDMQKDALREPLNSLHHEQALSRWRELRAKELSTAALVSFQQNVLAERSTQ